MGVVDGASSKSCDLDAREKASIPNTPKQFLRAASVPRDVLGPEQALSTSGRLGMGSVRRERNSHMEPQPNG